MPVITRSPTTNVAAGAPFNGPFSTPENGYANDGAYATAAPTKNAEFAHLYSGFDFSTLPDNAVINSVTIGAEYKFSTQASIGEFRLRALDGATLYEPNISDLTEPLADTFASVVLTTPLTATELKSAGFTIRAQFLRGNNNNAFTGSMDYITVAVDYTIPTTYSGSFVADSIILRAESGSFVADAIVRAAVAAVFTADAEIAPAPPTGPVWTGPPNNTTVADMTPTLEFTMPPSAATDMYFQIQLDKVNTFDGADLRTYTSFPDATGWEYHNGTAWVAMPATGVPAASAGNAARFTVPTPLSTGTWYRRIRSG